MWLFLRRFFFLCIASSNAASVLGAARLISTARIRFAKIGPLMNLNYRCLVVASAAKILSLACRRFSTALTSLLSDLGILAISVLFDRDAPGAYGGRRVAIRPRDSTLPSAHAAGVAAKVALLFAFLVGGFQNGRH